MLASGSYRGIEMDNGHLIDELRRLESEVVAGERQLAELEAIVAEMKREKLDISDREAELHQMRETQRRRQQDRDRLLSSLSSHSSGH
jgi:multidrug resistance efflux pump